MLWPGWGPVTVKSLTVICRALAGSELRTPPLLTVRVSVSLPTGHMALVVEPEAAPQLPVQAKVTGQLSGSVAEPFSVTLAPFALVAFTI